MRGRPGCLLQSAGGEANRILLASALSSMRIICPNRVSRRDWIIAVSLGCFVSLRTSSFRINWYHLMLKSLTILSEIPSLVRSSHKMGRLRKSNAARRSTNAAKVRWLKSCLRCAILHKVAMRSNVERPGVNPLC